MRSNIYFLSDLHLGAPYFADAKTAEKRIVSFLDSIKSEAKAIFLLGDVLDYWYEYRYVVPKGFVRFFGKLAELSDAGVRIVWLAGNHDIWLFDYFPNEIGIEVADGNLIEEFYGKFFFLSHGDGVGKLPRDFRIIRRIFRNKFCQRMYSSIHPRWTVPFASSWSRHSRMIGESKIEKDHKLLNNLTEFAKEYHLSNPEINYFLFGHLHLMVREVIGDNCEMIVLGDWIKSFSYAVFNDKGLELKRFEWPI